MRNGEVPSTDKFAELRKKAQAQLGKMIENMASYSPEKTRELVLELRTHQIELELQNETLLQTEFDLLAIQQEYSDLYDFVPIGYLTISNEGTIIKANLTASKMLDVERGNVINQPFSAYIEPENQDTYYFSKKEFLRSQKSSECELKLIRKDGSRFHALVKFSLNTVIDGTKGQYRIVISDITDRVQAEEEREKLIVKLQKALDEIKTLRGIIPICVYCKKIRDDRGAWDIMEAYITKHSDAEFSHGACPDCLKIEMEKLDNEEQ